VTDHVAEVMLGFDLLRELNTVWNFKNDEIELDGYVMAQPGDAESFVKVILKYQVGQRLFCRRKLYSMT